MKKTLKSFCVKCLPFLGFQSLSSNNDKVVRICRVVKVILFIFLPFTLAVFMLGTFTQTVQAKPKDIRDGDVWKFFKPEANRKPKFKWNHRGYDDSKWLKGQSGFGYGNSRARTKLQDMKGNYDSIYVRREFTVDDRDEIEGIFLTVDCDGAFIAYLNGIEVIRSKVKMNEELDISGFIHELIPGINVLSIQCFNDRVDSNDFTFIPTLKFVGQ